MRVVIWFRGLFEPPSADELMLRQREELRRQLLTYERALDQVKGDVMGLKESISRLDKDIQKMSKGSA